MTTANDWPKYEDGTNVEIGDSIDVGDGMPFVVDAVWFTADFTTIMEADSAGEHIVDGPLKRWVEDTWAKLEKDAAKMSEYAYWGCCDVDCKDCPHSVKPREKYKTSGCKAAVHFDLIHRARELAKREAANG